MHDCKSLVEERREKIWMSNSAGRRQTGERRHRSSYSALLSWSGRMEGASDEAESFAWSMNESLSSSAPRSGEVEDEEEMEASELRCCRLARAMVDNPKGIG